jgi:hypothetical protein
LVKSTAKFCCILQVSVFVVVFVSEPGQGCCLVTLIVAVKGASLLRYGLDNQLHTELWTSWASLLRSYAAAHGINSRHHAVVEVGADEITLRVASRWLRFTHETLQDSEGNQTGFSLQEDGTVKLNGIAEEMDLAAERLAREMMHSE